MAKNQSQRSAEEKLPPHSVEAERAALGCVLLVVEGVALLNGQYANAQAEQDQLLQQLRPGLFYQVDMALIFQAMIAIRMEQHALNVLTLNQWLKDKRKLQDAGGTSAITSLPDAAPSIFAFPTFLATLKDKALRRWALQRQAQLGELANAEDLSIEALQEAFSEIYERSTRIGVKNSPLKIWRTKELLDFKIPTHLRLVGDNEICMGYDGVALLAGPGSSGKSLAVAGLALAGAIGKGTWMGRAVHRQFTTLILQAENGSVRLKGEVEALAKNHPKVDIDSHIFISEPPEGGLPFHNTEFRTAVRHEISRLKPALVVVDPWSQVAAEDGAKEVVDKINEIRSCFPSGDGCPGLLIVAHTKKPRPEDVRRGRGLIHLVSGSVALANTARCAYVLLPWTEDLEDDRIYWACPKLNNGQMYAPTVWHRRFGTFFEHDGETDPKTWGQDEREETDQKVTEEDLIAAFGSEHVLQKSALAKRMEAKGVCSYQTAMRVITPGKYGYLADFVEFTKEGWVQLKEEKE